MAKGGGGGPSVSKETKKLQDLQTDQITQANRDRHRADNMQAEDRTSSARRQSMGLLSTILAGKDKEKLGD